jgi:hypothetical protein
MRGAADWPRDAGPSSLLSGLDRQFRCGTKRSYWHLRYRITLAEGIICHRHYIAGDEALRAETVSLAPLWDAINPCELIKLGTITPVFNFGGTVHCSAGVRNWDLECLNIW